MGRTVPNRHRVSHEPLAVILGFPPGETVFSLLLGALSPRLPSYLKPSADIQSRALASRLANSSRSPIYLRPQLGRAEAHSRQQESLRGP